MLLDDGFSTAALAEPNCIGDGCGPTANDVGGGAGADGSGGSGGSGVAGDGGDAGDAGATSGGTTNAGTGGAIDTGGTGGSVSVGGASGEAGAGGSTGQGVTEEACRTIEVTGTNYASTSNCLGLYGSGNLIMDTGTTLELSFDEGDPCFSGGVSSNGWGAVYELTFAGGDNGDTFWSAPNAGVSGFEFAYRGSGQPSALRILYKDPSGIDNCNVIGPGTTSVPFSAAHPDCDGSGATVDTTRLVELILVFPVGSGSYDVDFCVQIRAFD